MKSGSLYRQVLHKKREGEVVRKFLIATIVAVLFALCSPLDAQSTNSTTVMSQVDHWDNFGACLAATSAPKYHPTLRTNRALDPKKEKIDGMPEGCYLMVLLDRLHSPGWVRLEDGREGIYEYNPKTFAVGKLLRLKECNNNISDYRPFPPPKGAKGDPGPEGPKGNPGPPGENGKNGRNYVSPPLRWGFVGSVARATYSGPTLDRDVCQIDSWNLNAGVSFGDPTRFFARATFMAVLVDDGSSTKFDCPNCGHELLISRGMKVLGGNVELVALIGPRNWKLQPTLYAGGGGGFTLGKNDRYVTRNSAATYQEVDAEEFFGQKAFAHGGGGVGLTWHLDPNTSLEASGKYTYPYGWSLGVSATKWLK
jgi:hypothetical protein